MTIPTWNESTIRQKATDRSYSRGENYYQRGAVGPLVQRGNTLQAQVEGSQYEPYHVTITFNQGDIAGAHCSCPYDWGGWCKHIVATLLACLRKPDTIELRPPLEEQLGDLDREQLQSLLLSLVERNPELVNAIESQIILLKPQPSFTAAQPQPRRTLVDPQPIRRQVSYILHSLDRMSSSEAYWHAGSVVDQVRQMLKQVQDFIQANDGRNALVVLEAITDEYVSDWAVLDGSDGGTGEFFAELGEIWPEAILTADLTPQERRDWVRKLEQWQAEASDYGIDDVFATAQAAAKQGWDYPPLQQVLQGRITEQGAWQDQAPWYADELAIARLCVLERQGKHQEYLYLAQAEGQTRQYVIMLARLGRVQQAMDEGLQYLSTPDDTLALAKTLREQGELDSALRVAEHGLTLEGSKSSLAPWLCDLAKGLGQSELAFRAATAAFRAAPNLSAYLKVQEMAGERWPGLRTDLLEHLRSNSFIFASAQVDIFLHESLWDDATAAVEKGGGYDLIGRVMEAVVERRPEWVIQTARQQAERIINPGKAKYYHHAVNWLARARDGYQAAGRPAEWRAYLREIRVRHGRKYRLMEMLDALVGPGG